MPKNAKAAAAAHRREVAARAQLPGLVPGLRELRHPRPRGPAHRRRAEARPAPRPAHALGDGRRALPQGRQRRRRDHALPSARRRVDRRGAGRDGPAGLARRAAGQLRQRADGRRGRRAPLHRGAPDRPSRARCSSTRRRPTWQLELRRPRQGAGDAPGQVPDRAPRGRRGDRRRAVDEDPAAQLQRPVPGGHQPPPGQDVPDLPRLSRRAASRTSPSTTTASAAAR